MIRTETVTTSQAPSISFCVQKPSPPKGERWDWSRKKSQEVAIKGKGIGSYWKDGKRDNKRGLRSRKGSRSTSQEKTGSVSKKGVP